MDAKRINDYGKEYRDLIDKLYPTEKSIKKINSETNSDNKKQK